VHPVLSSRFLRCAALVVAACVCPSLAADASAGQKHLSADEWRQDLHFLAEQMRLRHKSLFHSMTEAGFDAAVQELDADIPRLNDDEIVVRLAQLVALVQDGHSNLDVQPILSSGPDDHIPIRFDRYEDGIYVRAAAPEYADAVGGKLLKVGSVGWKEAIARLDSTRSHDPGNNREQLAWVAKVYLNWPRILHGLGLSSSSEQVDYVIEKDGQQGKYTMKPSYALGNWAINAIPPGWVDARFNSAHAPLSRLHEDEAYWFTSLPEQHSIYFQFNLVSALGGEPLADFSQRLSLALSDPAVDRLVIDVRNNTGGDNTLLRPLLVALIRSRQNHRGGMYVITGPTTFSACQNFVNRLENYADVIFVGLPTAENVNFYGDPAEITLPHSQLQAGVSRLWWQDKDPRDTRLATFPEIAAVSTFADYLAGRDPVLELALTAPTPPTIEDVLKQALPDGFDAILSSYQRFVQAPLHRYLPDPERQVNSLGYELLGANKTQEAILIFRLNVRTHGDSFNAYDSLGEGYAAAGDNPHALEAYRRSVELNPENENGRRMIQKLEQRK
jgi:tetratricopeptide (TPR) repeat protein